MTPMRERREATRSADDELDLRHQVSRQEARKIESRRALQRLTGSYVLGGIAAWKLLTYDAAAGVPWYVWVGLASIAFGLASFDQVLKVIKR